MLSTIRIMRGIIPIFFTGLITVSAFWLHTVHSQQSYLIRKLHCSLDGVP